MNIKRWLLCAFLFLICFLFLRWLNNKNIIVEGHGGGGMGHGGGHGGGRGRGRYYGGGGTAYGSPLYVYEEVDDYPPPYCFRVPFF